MTDSKQILVGVDYSEPGGSALRKAAALAQQGVLHAIHVVLPAVAAPPGIGAALSFPGSIDQDATTLAKYLDQQLKGFDGERPARVISHVAVGVPAEAITQLAAELGVDLIVVGTHGRQGFERFVLGSTAECVVRWAPCPVLVERPKASTAADAPRIEPACPRCLEARKATQGAELWCAQHRERHGRRHTYHSADRSSAFPSPHGGLGSIS